MFRKYFVGGTVLWVVIIFLCLFSLAVLYSGNAAKRSVYHFVTLGPQTFYMTLGLFGMWVISWSVSPSWLIRIARPLVVLSIFVSLLPFVPVLGANINSAARWIKLPFVNINPFEFLKVFVMLDLVSQLSKIATTVNKTSIVPSLWKIRNKKDREEIKKILLSRTLPIFWPSLAAMLITSVSNFSTTVILFIMTLVILCLGGAKISDILKMVVYVIFFGVVFVWASYNLNFGRGTTIVNRLKNMFDLPIQPVNVEDSRTISFNSAISKEDLSEEYSFKSSDSKVVEYKDQDEIAKGTIASGGFLGKGPGNSTFRAKLPHATSDCVFAFVVEEYGFLGGCFLIVAYLMILFSGYAIALRSRYYSFYLLSLAIVIHIFLTAMINMTVSVGLIVTGQTLPFVGSGGSSFLANSIAVGILMGISACPPREAKLEMKDND